MNFKQNLETFSKNFPNAYGFIRDLFTTFDLVTLVTFVLFTASLYQFLEMEYCLVLGLFYLIRGFGHFWGIRQCGDGPFQDASQDIIDTSKFNLEKLSSDAQLILATIKETVNKKISVPKMRFMPVFGGYIQTFRRFIRRLDEGFSSLGASIWVLVFALFAFSIYLVTGNLTALIFSMVSFGINLVALVPIIPDFDGEIVVKSITFSLSKTLGLAFVFLNIFTLPALIYMVLSTRGPVDMTMFFPMIIAGAQRFVEEQKKDDKIEPMSRDQAWRLSLLYIGLFLSFLLMPGIFKICTVSSLMQAEIDYAITFGVISMIVVSVVECNVIFFINLKRRIFGNI